MKKRTIILLVLIIFLHFIFFFFSADQLFYGDEVVFLTAAEEISNGQITGSFGYEDGRLIKDRSAMLFHPPIYIYLLSLFMYLFGLTTYTVRSVGLLFSIGSIILVFLISRNLLEDKTEKAEEWSLIASLLYAISPVVIQNVILIDIDTMLTFFILLFFYFYFTGKNSYYLVPTLFMIFSSKLTGAVVLLATLIVLKISTGEYKKLGKTILMFLITGLAFFLAFFTYTKIFDLNSNYLFFHNSFLGVLKNFITSPEAIPRSLWSLKTFFYFGTPFLLFLFVILSLYFVNNIIKDKRGYIIRNEKIFVIWLFSLMTFLFVFLLAQSGFNFVKYYVSAMPFIILLIIYFTPKRIRNMGEALPTIIITTIIVLTYFVVFLGDPLIPEIQGRVLTVSFLEVGKLVFIRTLTYAIIPIFLCVGLFRRLPRKKMWMVLFFLLIITSFYLNVIHIKADYSTHNIYGDKGLDEVIEYMGDKKSENILCYIHVCYFIDYKNNFELTTLFHDMDKLRNIIEEEDIDYMIIYKKDLVFIPIDILNEFEKEKIFDDYIILKIIRLQSLKQL